MSYYPKVLLIYKILLLKNFVGVLVDVVGDFPQNLK